MMLQLDEMTTRLLIRVLEKLKDSPEFEMRVADHPTLRVVLEGPLAANEGDGFALSIGELHPSNPALYRSRMVFLVIHQPHLCIFPISYHDEVNQVSEIAAIVLGDRVVGWMGAIQHVLVRYTQLWLGELATAEYF